VYNIFEKLEMAHAHYEANIMKPPSRSRLQLPLAVPTRSSHSSSRAKMVYLVAPSVPPCNYCGNPTHQTSECNIPFEDLFCDYCGKREIREFFVLPSFQNISNFDYHSKICQHLPLPLNQKPKHLSLPPKLSPPRVITIRMPRRRSTMLTRRRCFKPMSFKFKFFKMNSNH